METQEHQNNNQGAAIIDIFLQGEGIEEIILLQLPENSKVAEVIEIAKAKGCPVDDSMAAAVFLENEEEPVKDIEKTIKSVGIHHRKRIHVHRCRKIAVTVNFNSEQKMREFPASATIKRVHRWAVGENGFKLDDQDATEHALQLCGTDVRPDEEKHVGTLTTFPTCTVCFDLVPKIRVEG
jgi:hypothetical protein